MTLPVLAPLLLLAAAIAPLSSAGLSPPSATTVLVFRRDPAFSGDGCVASLSNSVPRWSAHLSSVASVQVVGNRVRLDAFVQPLNRSARLRAARLLLGSTGPVARWSPADGRSKRVDLGPWRVALHIDPAVGGYALLERVPSRRAAGRLRLQFQLHGAGQSLSSNVVYLSFRAATSRRSQPGQLCRRRLKPNPAIFDMTPAVAYFVPDSPAELIVPVPVSEEPLETRLERRRLWVETQTARMEFQFSTGPPSVSVYREVDPRRRVQALVLVFSDLKTDAVVNVTAKSSRNPRDQFARKTVWIKMLPNPNISCEGYSKFITQEGVVKCQFHNVDAFKDLLIEDGFTKGGERVRTAPIRKSGIVSIKYDVKNWCRFSRTDEVYKLVMYQNVSRWLPLTTPQAKFLSRVYSHEFKNEWKKCAGPSKSIIPYATYFIRRQSTADNSLVYLPRTTKRIPVHILRRAIQKKVGFRPELLIMKAKSPSGKDLILTADGTGPGAKMVYADESGYQWKSLTNIKTMAHVLGDADPDLIVAGTWTQIVYYYKLD